MKGPSIFLMAAIKAALVGTATEGFPIDNNLYDMKFYFTPLGAESMSQATFEILHINDRQCGTKNADKASAQDTDSLHDGFKNNFAAEGPRTFDSQVNQSVQSHRSQDDIIAGANDEVCAQKQNSNLKNKGRDLKISREGTPSDPLDPKRPNLASSSQLEDGQSPSYISIHYSEGMQVCQEKILPLDYKLKNSNKDVEVEVKIKEIIAPDQVKLICTRKQLEDGHTLSDYALTSFPGAAFTKPSISKDPAHVTQTSYAPDIFLKIFSQTPDLAQYLAFVSCNTITFSEQSPHANFDLLQASNEGKATSRASDETTAALTFSQGISFPTPAIFSALYQKISNITQILAETLQRFTCDNPLTFGSITANNLSQTEGDSKPASSSAPASPQTSKATAHPESTRTSACDSANSTCLYSKQAANLLVNFDQCSSFDPAQTSEKVESARAACQREKSCEVQLDAVIDSKQSKFVPNLETLTDPISSRAHKKTEKVYQKKTQNPCDLILAELAKNLTRHFESSYFRTMQIGDPPRAQTKSLSDTVSEDFDQHYWHQLCGQLTFTAIGSHSSLFGGLAWEDAEHHPSTTRIRGRRLQASDVIQGICPTVSSNFNLLNEGNVDAKQSFGLTSYNTNANKGCDGIIQYYNPTIIFTNVVSVTVHSNEYWWVAILSSVKWIQSILYIDSSGTQNVQIYVGESSSNGYRDSTNKQCLGGQLTAGGFYNCGKNGKYIAITSTTGPFEFMEVMAYSEHFIHHLAVSSTLTSTLNTAGLPYYCTTSTNCKASNLLRTTLVIWNDGSVGTMPCCIYSQSETTPQLTVTFKTEVAIKFVVFIPSDQPGSSVTDWQTSANIRVLVYNIAGLSQQCGSTYLSTYNTYKEIPCNNQIGNQIVVTKMNGGHLSMAGMGIFAQLQCDCSSSSFNPALFSPVTSYALSGSSTDATKIIKVMPDTVSSVCGNGDGFTYCPHTVDFQRIESGNWFNFQFVSIPGFTWTPATSELTINPALAQTFSFQAVVSITGSSPLVTITQPISWNVNSALPTAPTAPNTAISGTTDVTISWVAPANGGSAITEYKVAILQNDNLPYSGYTGCTGTAVTCTVPISVLKAAPYNLVNGASVYAQVQATNSIGSSAYSSAGNGAVLPTVPTAPAAPTTTISGSNVVINWAAPADGGSPITGYLVVIQKSDGVSYQNYAGCTGTAVSCTFAISFLKAAPYNLANGASVYAQILAQNAIGISAGSPAGNGAVLQTAPSTPTAPTTVISGSNVVINWAAPTDGGSAITGYTVKILQSDGVTYTAHTGCTGTAVSCTVAISVLQAAPYNLANGASVYAQVIATNAIGNSAASPAGNGAVLPATVPSAPAAPTTSISGTNVIINWVAPADGGSAITGYDVLIRQSDGVTYTTYTGCTGSTVSCTVPISVLQAVPYNLANGASVCAQVIATNAIGSSATSPAGNGAILPATVPSTPAAPTTTVSGSNVLINWTAPANGGSEITGYSLEILQNDGVTYSTFTGCTGTAVSCTVPMSVLKSMPYNLANGVSVYAKVTATNALGPSAASLQGNGAVIPTATAPSVPTAPTIAISGNNVLISWVAPADGGSVITGYTVAIRLSDGKTFTALTTCTGTTTSCSVPFSVLKAAPHNLVEGVSISATVLATNVVGSSSASTPGNGEFIASKAKTLFIASETLNAVIGKEFSHLLPPFVGVSYNVLSKQQFQVSVEGNLLKVKSDSVSDLGSHQLRMNAQTSNESIDFTVNVIFDKLVTTQDATVIYTQKTESFTLSTKEADPLFETTTSCTIDESEILSCVTAKSFQYSVDPNKTAKSTKYEFSPEKPILTVSKVSSLGEFNLKFSKAMNLKALYNTTNEKQLLEVVNTTLNENLVNYRYLLSPKHLRIEIKSANSTKHRFTWNAVNITQYEIQMQLVFEDPLYISNESQLLDMLQITVLPPALEFFQTIGSKLLTKNPLETFTLTLPPQVIPGKTIEIVGRTVQIMEQGSQYAAFANLAVQLAVSGSMGQMWSMVNSFQIIQSFNFLRLNVPGNVLLVMTNFNNMLNLSALETEQITSGLFNFTETQAPGAGFNEMGDDSKNLILFLGNVFFIALFLLAVYLLYGFVNCCGHSNRCCKKTDLWLRPQLICGALICYQLESQLDYCLGTFLNFEEPNLYTPSDIFNFGLCILSVLCLLLLPLTQIKCLCKNKDKMDDRKFKAKWGGLYAGMKTFAPQQRLTAIKMLFWFLFRRMLTALNLVLLRGQTTWIQLTLNMWLCLTDASLILHWSPYETKTRNFMEKLNFVVVLFLGQLIYMQTDLIPSVEDRYYIGWYYLGVLGLIFVANISVMVISATNNFTQKCKRSILRRKHNKALALKQKKTAHLKAILAVNNSELLGTVFDKPLPSKRELLLFEKKAQVNKPRVDHIIIRQLVQSLQDLDDKLEENRARNIGVALINAKPRHTLLARTQVSQEKLVNQERGQQRKNDLVTKTNAKLRALHLTKEQRSVEPKTSKDLQIIDDSIKVELQEMKNQRQKKLENLRMLQQIKVAQMVEREQQKRYALDRKQVIVRHARQIQQMRQEKAIIKFQDQQQKREEVKKSDLQFQTPSQPIQRRQEILLQNHSPDFEQQRPPLFKPQPRREIDAQFSFRDPAIKRNTPRKIDYSKFAMLDSKDMEEHKRRVDQLLKTPGFDMYSP